MGNTRQFKPSQVPRKRKLFNLFVSLRSRGSNDSEEQLEDNIAARKCSELPWIEDAQRSHRVEDPMIVHGGFSYSVSTNQTSFDRWSLERTTPLTVKAYYAAYANPMSGPAELPGLPLRRGRALSLDQSLREFGLEMATSDSSFDSSGSGRDISTRSLYTPAEHPQEAGSAKLRPKNRVVSPTGMSSAAMLSPPKALAARHRRLFSGFLSFKSRPVLPPLAAAT